MPNRRSWLIVAAAVAAAGAAGPILTQRLEANVTTPNLPTLTLDKLDDERFPELKVDVGQKGIRAKLLHPPGDPRVPAPQGSITLVVAFRLDEPGVSADPAVQPPVWQLSWDATDKAGAVQRQSVPILPKPMDGNFSARATPDPRIVMPPGMIYRGAYWVALTELYRMKVLRPGMAVELSYAQQARFSLTLT